MPDNPLPSPLSPSLAFWLSPLPERQKTRSFLLSASSVLFKITKSRRFPRSAWVVSSLTSVERRDEWHSGLLLSSPSPTVSHPLLSPPPSVCEERCSRLSSILLSSLSGLSLSLSLSLMLVLIPFALLPPPFLPLSLLAASVIYAFMRVCMHAQAAEHLSL